MDRPAHAIERPSLREQEVVLEREGRVEELIRLYETRAHEAVAPSEVAELLVKAAELARGQQRDLPRAAELLRQATVLAPDEREPLLRLRAVYEQQQEHGALVAVLERLGVRTKGAQSAAFFMRAAEVYEHQLNRRARAVLCCQLASKADPTEREALRQVRRLFLQEGRYLPAFESLARECATLGPAGMADEYAGFAEVLADDPSAQPLVEKALERALSLEPGHGPAAALRRSLERLPETWRDRVRALRAAGQHERDAKKGARLQLLIAKLLERFDPTAARKTNEAIKKCLSLWPTMPDALNFLEARAEAAGRLDELASRLEKMAEEQAAALDRVTLLLRAGTLRLSRLNDPSGALVSFQKAAEADFSREDAVSLAYELLLEAGRLRDAAALLEKHLGAVRERWSHVELRLRLGDLFARSIGDAGSARPHYEAALELDGSNARAALALAEICSAKGGLAEAIRHLPLAVRAPAPKEFRVALCSKVGDEAERQGEREGAIEAFLLGLGVEPARIDLAERALALVGNGPERLPVLARIRRTAQGAERAAAIELWRRLGRQAAQAHDTEDAWERLLALAPDDAEALAARVQDRARPRESDDAIRGRREAEVLRLSSPMRDPAALVEACRELLALAPEDVTALRALQDAYGALGKWDELGKVLASLARVTPRPSERLEARERLAQLSAERLSRKGEAATLFLELLAEGVSSLAVVRGLERLAHEGVAAEEIGEALAPHYARTGEHQRKSARLRVRGAAATSAEGRREALRELSEHLQHALADGRGALTQRLKLLAQTPDDEEARAAVVGLSRLLGARAEASSALLAIAQQAPGPVGDALCFEAVGLAEEGGVVSALVRALAATCQRAPSDWELRARLARLYEKQGRLTDASAALAAAAGVAPSGRREQLWAERSVLEERLGNPDSAARALEESVRGSPPPLETAERWCALLRRSGAVAQLAVALALLEEVATAAGASSVADEARQEAEQVQALLARERETGAPRHVERLATRPDDAEARRALEGLLGQPSQALAAARALCSVYDAAREPRELLVALELIATGAPDVVERVEALRRTARVHRETLQQPELAFAALARALELSPGESSLLTPARAAAEESDSLETYVEVLEELLEELAPGARGSVLRELAECYEKLGERSSAIQRLRAAEAAEPGSLEPLRALSRLHRANGEWAALAEALESLAVQSPELSARLAAWREAAQLQESRLWDVESAANSWRRVIDLDPLDREAATALERTALELGRPQELVFALELARAQEGQGPRALDLTVRLAVLKAEKLGDVRGAVELCAEVLEADPKHAAARAGLEAWASQIDKGGAEAFRRLDAILAAAGDHDERLALRESRLGALPEAERPPLVEECLAILERELDEPERALLFGLKWLVPGGDAVRLFSMLEGLAERTETLEELAELFDNKAEEPGIGAEGTLVLLKRAARLRERLGDAEGAAFAWRRIAETSPTDVEAVERTGKHVLLAEAARDESEALSKQADSASTPAERAALSLKAAAALERAGDDRQAEAAYRVALVADPSHQALAGLERILGRSGRHREQAELLERMLSTVSDAGGQVELLARQGRLWEREGEGVLALRSYVRALEASASVKGSGEREAELVAGLERLCERDDVREGAARALEQLYRRVGNRRRLAELLPVRLEAESGEVRAGLLRELAELREEQGDRSGALVAWIKGFAENPRHEETRSRLERLAESTKAYEELAAAFEDRLEAGEGEPLAAELWEKLGWLYLGPLPRPELAVRAWEEVSRRRPKSLLALGSLAEAYRRTHAYRPLAGVMQRQAELEPSPEVRINLYYELAQLAEESLGDRDLAASCYEKILELAPGDRAALKALQKIAADTRRHSDLAGLLELEILLLKDIGGSTEDLVDLQIRLARLRLTRLSDAKGALKLVRQSLAAIPNHPGAIELLEETSRVGGALAAEALALLEPILASSGGQERLVAVLEGQASASKSAKERAALLRRIATLRAGPGKDVELAFLAAARALREEPEDSETLTLCSSLAQQSDSEDALVALLEELAPSSPRLARELSRRLEASGQADEALEIHRRLFVESPEDAAAVDELVALGTRAGLRRRVIESLESVLGGENPPPNALELQRRLAGLHEAEGDAPLAVRTWESVASREPTSPEAWTALARLYREAKNHEQLVRVLEQLADLETRPDPKAALFLEIAEVAERALSDTELALSAYRGVLAVRPYDLGAVRAQQRLYAGAGRTREQARALERELELMRSSGAPVAELAEREVRWARLQLSSTEPEEAEQAFAVLERLLESGAGQTAAIEALGEVALSGSPLAKDAARRVRPHLSRSGELAREVSVLEVLAAASSSPEERAAYFLDAAALCERKLDDAERALMLAGRALREQPQDEGALEVCLRCAEQAGAFDELVALLEEVAPDCPPGTERVALYRALARACERASDDAGAEAAWREVLQGLPEDEEALARLEEALARRGSAEALDRHLTNRLERARDAKERFDLLCRQARAREQAGNAVAAIDSLQLALALEANGEVLESLDRLLGAEGRPDEQVEVLTKLVARTTEPRLRSERLTRLGQLLLRLERHAAAVDAFGELLSLTPDDARALEALEGLMEASDVRGEAARRLESFYRERSDGRRLASALEAQLQGASAARRKALLEELRPLRATLGDRRGALAAALEQLADRPSDSELWAEAERLAEASGAVAELANTYRELLQRHGEAPWTTELWGRLGTLYERRLGRAELAVEAWSEVARRRPADVETARTLTRLYRNLARPMELALALTRQVTLEPRPEQQAQLWYELAVLQTERLESPSDGMVSLRRLLELEPAHGAGAELLAKLLEESAPVRELEAFFEQRLELLAREGTSVEVNRLRVRLARLRLTRLDDGAGALFLLSAALNEGAGTEAVAALQEMMRSTSSLRARAAELLEPLYAAAGENRLLVEALEVLLAEAEEPARREALLRRIAELQEGPLWELGAAFVTYGRLLRERPDDLGLLRKCVELAEATGSQGQLSALLMDCAPRASSDVSRAALYRTLASVLEERGQSELSLEAWEKVPAAHPTEALEALQARARLLERLERWPELAEVLARQVDAEPAVETRAVLLERFGGLLDLRLGRKEEALDAYRRLLEARPGDAPVLERASRLCTELGRWAELEGILERRIARSPDDDSTALKLELARVRAEHLGNPAGAVELYAALLARDSRQAVALARLEELARTRPDDERAAEVLLDAYREGGDVQKLCAALEARAAAVGSGPRRKALLAELAQVRDELQDEPMLALEALGRAFREDPLDTAMLEQLKQLADLADAHEALARLLEEVLPKVTQPEAASALCLRLGHLLERRVGAPERAIRYYQQARQLDPGAARIALEALERIHESRSEHAALADVLEASLELETDLGAKLKLLQRLGQLAEERLGDARRAATAFEQLLRLDPRSQLAARSLERIYESAGEHALLFSLLERQRAGAVGRERETAGLRMVRVLAEAQQRPEEAVVLARELLAENPRSEPVFLALDALLAQTGRHDELRKLIEARLARVLDPREILRLHERLGHVLWRLQGKPAEAVGHYRAALERDGRSEASLLALRELYEELGRKQELSDILRRLIVVRERSPELRSWRLRLAELCAELGRGREALEVARTALEPVKDGGAGMLDEASLERLLTLFSELDAQVEAARVLQLRADVALEAGNRAAALGLLYEAAARLNRPPSPVRAAPILERMLALAPEHRDAHAMALEIYEGAGDWESYVRGVERFLPHQSKAEAVASLRTLAKMQAERMQDARAAVTSLCRALRLSPSEPIRGTLEALAQQTSSLQVVAELYGELAEGLPRERLAVELLMARATILDRQLDRPGQARAAYEAILAFEPAEAAAHEALVAMLGRRGLHREQVEALLRLREVASSTEQRKALCREIARLQDEALDDGVAAAATLRELVAIEPSRPSYELLMALHRRRGQWREAVGCLGELRELVPDRAKKSAYQLEIAELCRRELGDVEAAVAACYRAVELDGENDGALQLLEELLDELDRPTELLSAIERRVQLAAGVAQKVALLFRAAQVLEDRLGNPTRADACMETVLGFDPGNLEALRALARLRREREDWEGLASALERRLAVASSPADISAIEVDLGDLFRERLFQAERAIRSYRHALEVDAACLPALRGLSTLYERRGDWSRAVEVLLREAELLGRSPEAVALFCRVAQVYAEVLFDSGRAREALSQARRIEPANLPAIRALRALFERERDWVGVERALLDEATATDGAPEKTKVLLELVALYTERLRDEGRRSWALSEALRYSPRSVEAAAPLAEAALAKEDWATAERLFDIVTQELSSRRERRDAAAVRQLAAHWRKLGRACQQLGKVDKGIDAVRSALQTDPGQLAAREELGSMLVEAGRSTEALQVYQSILENHRHELNEQGLVAAYCRIGELHAHLGQPDKAQAEFDRALSASPNHQQALRALARLATDAGRFRNAAEYRHRLSLQLEGEAKFEACVELAKLARDKVGDSFMAIDAYVRALKVKPDALFVMDALYSTYREARQPSKAAKMLDGMLAHRELQTDLDRRRRVLFALGEVAAQELADVERAVSAYEAALDLDPAFSEAFEAVERVLTAGKRWRQLEEAYVRMLGRLERVQRGPAARAVLWKALGALRAGPLGSASTALEAFHRAAELAPEDASVHEALGKLALKLGDESLALSSYRRALAGTEQPGKVSSAIAQLAMRARDHDTALFAAQIADQLFGVSGDQEKEILSSLGPVAEQREVARLPVSERSWQSHLLHPRVRGPLGDLMAILFEQMGHVYSESHSKFDLSPKKHRLSLGAGSGPDRLREVRYVARLLGLERVEVFSPYFVASLEPPARRPVPMPDVGVSAELCTTDPPAVKLGGRFFSVQDTRESRAVLAFSFCLLRPELALARRLPLDRLDTLLQAVLSLNDEQYPSTVEPRTLKKVRKLVEKSCSASALQALSGVVRKYRAVARPDDLQAYIEGVELTAVRAALLASGDMLSTRRALLDGKGLIHHLSAQKTLRDLVGFALGGDLVALRAQIGTGVAP